MHGLGVLLGLGPARRGRPQGGILNSTLLAQGAGTPAGQIPAVLEQQSSAITTATIAALRLGTEIVTVQSGPNGYKVGFGTSLQGLRDSLSVPRITASCSDFRLSDAPSAGPSGGGGGGGGGGGEDESEDSDAEEEGEGGVAVAALKERAEEENSLKGRFAAMLMLRFLLSSVFGLAHSPGKSAIDAVPSPKLPEFLKDEKVGDKDLIDVWKKSWGLKDLSTAPKGRLGIHRMMMLMQWVMKEVEAGRAVLHCSSTAKQWSDDRRYLETGTGAASAGAKSLFADPSWDRVLTVPTTPPHDPVRSERFMMRCLKLFIPKGIVDLVCTDAQKIAAKATGGCYVLLDNATVQRKRMAGESLGKSDNRGRKKHKPLAAQAAAEVPAAAAANNGAGAAADGAVAAAEAAAAVAAAEVLASVGVQSGKGGKGSNGANNAKRYVVCASKGPNFPYFSPSLSHPPSLYNTRQTVKK